VIATERTNIAIDPLEAVLALVQVVLQDVQHLTHPGTLPCMLTAAA